MEQHPIRARQQFKQSLGVEVTTLSGQGSDFNLFSTECEAHDGELGTMLKLTEALEADDGGACSDIAEQLPGLDAWTINTCLAQALAWANNIGRENEASA